ncbi:hypothetical protein GIB67_041389 [Kingdonia uniflora]|uniref:Uncharacterized protein n=1 Tax=Kingdonia uniflora TaxID=39325 RepID=A0A7J7LRQ1_9MAGN|nr:hypothetical protein GIB67_041389 [Kingdonia uniflora]
MAKNDTRKMITFDENAQPIGKNRANFSSNIGLAVKTHCSIFHIFWKHVSDDSKNTVWKTIKRKPGVIAHRKGGKNAKKAMKSLHTTGRRGTGRTAENMVLCSKLAFGFFLGGGALDITSYYFAFLQWLFMFSGL